MRRRPLEYLASGVHSYGGKYAGCVGERVSCSSAHNLMHFTVGLSSEIVSLAQVVEVRCLRAIAGNNCREFSETAADESGRQQRSDPEIFK